MTKRYHLIRIFLVLVLQRITPLCKSGLVQQLLPACMVYARPVTSWQFQFLMNECLNVVVVELTSNRFVLCIFVNCRPVTLTYGQNNEV